MSATELLLEIGTEEIPARFLPEAEANLAQRLTEKLRALNLNFGELLVYSTPRRLTVTVDRLATRQPDRNIEKMGPAKKVAYNDEGKPTKAAIGFAKGQGVEIDELELFTTEKGEYIGIKKTISGQPTADILPEALTEIILALPWPKSMRWGDLDLRFVRPVHWIVALLGGETLPITIGEIPAGAQTRGHRFHSPAAIEVTDFADYRDKLAAAKVTLDAAQRREVIRAKLDEFAGQLSGKWIVDEELLTHVAYLVEWPVPLLGRFPAEYLELPREVLVTTMSTHQKYFSFEDAQGALLPAFCLVANIEADDPELVVRGNQRVLVARLEDAKYYWETDRKKPLDDFAADLEGMLYHKLLGSYAEKVDRVRKLVNYFGAMVATDSLDTAKRAAQIYKADLLTGMVAEFPELQGIIGRYYAREQGEEEAVGEAIFEHYLPRFAGDELPASDAGAVLSVCDKMDSIAACFGVGLSPTGSGDPYALRRQALGVLHILAERAWDVALTDLIRKSVDGVEDKFKADRADLEEEILAFFRDRLFHFMRGRGMRAEVADAVLAVRFDTVPATVARIEAVNEFSKRDEFEAFATAFKRAGNIVKDYEDPGEVDEALLEEDAEKALFAAVQSIADQVQTLVAVGDVLGALMTISEIRPQVDVFFDDVLVMHKKEDIKTNRLNLVASVTALFSAIADFRRI
ncbi:MAG: glycine--tRNA ligase subunit beta [Candidatus Lernaella stagnicola]|nr:glycine--tRNA ligase subunit beta [Candidatus Lernaella stagnicola]